MNKNQQLLWVPQSFWFEYNDIMTITLTDTLTFTVWRGSLFFFQSLRFQIFFHCIPPYPSCREFWLACKCFQIKLPPTWRRPRFGRFVGWSYRETRLFSSARRPTPAKGHMSIPAWRDPPISARRYGTGNTGGSRSIPGTPFPRPTAACRTAPGTGHTPSHSSTAEASIPSPCHLQRWCQILVLRA